MFSWVSCLFLSFCDKTLLCCTSLDKIIFEQFQFSHNLALWGSTKSTRNSPYHLKRNNVFFMRESYKCDISRVELVFYFSHMLELAKSLNNSTLARIKFESNLALWYSKIAQISSSDKSRSILKLGVISTLNSRYTNRNIRIKLGMSQYNPYI